MQARIGFNRNTAVLAIAIAALVVSAVTATMVFTAPYSASKRSATHEGEYFNRFRPMFSLLRQRHAGTSGTPIAGSHMHRGFPASSHWEEGLSRNVTKPSTILNVTSDQAKAKANDAIKEFKVGDAKDTGNLWAVSIRYKDKVVMTVLLGKLNTPTSDDAVKAVQDSLEKGWEAGEPRQLQFIYNVPVIDAQGNAVGNIRVDGRSGEITTGFLMLPR